MAIDYDKLRNVIGVGSGAGGTRWDNVYSSTSTTSIDPSWLQNAIATGKGDREHCISARDLLTDPVFQLEVPALRAAWLTRFGSGWVCYDDVSEDTYMMKVYARLSSLSELEKHYVADEKMFFARIRS